MNLLGLEPAGQHPAGAAPGWSNTWRLQGPAK